MSSLDAFLRWSHPDLLDERLLHCSAHWQVIQTLGLGCTDIAAPDEGPVSLLRWSGPGLAISSASAAQPRSVSFNLGSRAVAVHLFCLFDPGEHDHPDPLDASAWRFWVVANSRLHPERRTLGLQPLIRAEGEGLGIATLAAALAVHLPQA